MLTKIPGDPIRFQRMTTNELRASYLLDHLFTRGEVSMCYVETDRTVVGSAVPGEKELTIATAKQLASNYFAERREVGVLNLGGAGSVVVDGTTYEMGPKDGLYIGRGSKEIVFRSDAPTQPAQFYIVSYPAHKAFPTKHVRFDDAERMDLGHAKGANVRTIHKYIHPGSMETCQLVMGITTLAEGSVWNTMPCHTHARRSEIYMYFGLGAEDILVHLMGPPDETKHLIVRDRQAIVSPSWSIHSGCATSSYSFAWAMGGENQEFTDMDGAAMDEVR